MCRLEHSMASQVVDVAAGGNADAANLGGKCVGNIVTVEIEGGHDVVLVRPGQNLLQKRVGDDVLDDDAVRQLAPGPAIELDRAKLALRQLVAPVTKGALGELHDVALVDERQALALVGNRIFKGGPN